MIINRSVKINIYFKNFKYLYGYLFLNIYNKTRPILSGFVYKNLFFPFYSLLF